jgi:hypothetical protein
VEVDPIGLGYVIPDMPGRIGYDRAKLTYGALIDALRPAGALTSLTRQLTSPLDQREFGQDKINS